MTALLTFFGLNLSSARSRLLGEGLWAATGQGLAALGTLAGMRLLTEVVPPTVFGIVTLLLAMATLGYNFFCSPLLLAGARFYSDAAQRGEVPVLRRTLSRMLGRTTVGLVAVGLMVGALWGGRFGCSIGAFIALAGLLAVDAARAFELSFLTAARRQRPVALWLAAEAWGRPLAAFGAVTVFSVSAEMVLAGYLAASAGCWLAFLWTQPRTAESAAFETASAGPALRREVLHYVLPLVPLAVVGWVNSYSDRYFIAQALGAEQVGIFAAALGLASRPFLMAGTVVAQTLRPIYFNAVSSGDQAEERRVFRLWLTVTAAVSAAGVGAFILLGDLVGELLLAASYRSGLSLFSGIAAGFALSAIANTLGERFFAHKRTRTLMIIQAALAVVYVALVWPLVSRFGLNGAVLAFALYSLISVVAFGLVGMRLTTKVSTREIP